MKTPARHKALAWGLGLWVLALGAVASDGNAANVDANTVGTWALAVHAGRWLWTIDSDGSYEFHSEAADGVAPHAGKFSAAGGNWSLEATNGYFDGGTYVFQPPDTLVATGHLGTAGWHRITKVTNDLNTVGTWESSVNGDKWVWKIDANSDYDFHSDPSDGVAPHTGKFSASSGYWWLQATNGYADGGTYSFEPPDTLVTTGYLGSATWHRSIKVVGTAGDEEINSRGAVDNSGDLCWFRALEAWSQPSKANECP